MHVFSAFRGRYPEKGRSFLNLLRHLQTIFHSGYTNLHSYQQCSRAPFSPYPLYHFLFLVILITAILTDMRWYLMVVLIFISLVTSGAEHPFIYLLAIYMCSLEKHPGPLPNFSLDCLGFVVVVEFYEFFIYFE